MICYTEGEEYNFTQARNSKVSQASVHPSGNVYYRKQATSAPELLCGVHYFNFREYPFILFGHNKYRESVHISS